MPESTPVPALFCFFCPWPPAALTPAIPGTSDVATVRTIWRTKLEVGGLPTAPVAAGGMVFLADRDGVVRALDADPGIDSRVCVTAQHRGMLDQVLEFFQIEPRHDLDLMQHAQGLADVTGRVLNGVFAVVEALKILLDEQRQYLAAFDG